jgi:hypothetical protein
MGILGTRYWWSANGSAWLRASVRPDRPTLVAWWPRKEKRDVCCSYRTHTCPFPWSTHGSVCDLPSIVVRCSSQSARRAKALWSVLHFTCSSTAQAPAKWDSVMRAGCLLVPSIYSGYENGSLWEERGARIYLRHLLLLGDHGHWAPHEHMHFMWLLHVFHLNVAYIVVAIHVCCNLPNV